MLNSSRVVKEEISNLIAMDLWKVNCLSTKQKKFKEKDDEFIKVRW